MAKFRVPFESDNFTDDEKAFKKALRAVAEKLQQKLQAGIKAKRGNKLGPYHRETGESTAESIKVGVSGDDIVITSRAPHFRILLEGTTKHNYDITAKPGSALSFQVGKFKLPKAGSRNIIGLKGRTATSGTVTVTKVTHPGSAPHPFLKKAVSELPTLLSREVRRVLEGT